MSRFHRYSLSNQLLILMQRPQATDVRGYRAWQHAGHQVRKGEKGIAIWAPCGTRQSADSPVLEPDAKDPDSTPRPRFRVAYVWDLASCDTTDGATAVVADTVSTLNTEADRWVLRLHAVINAQFPIQTLPLPQHLYGHTDGRTIVVNARHDPTTRCATLIHEYTHAQLHFTAGETRPDLTTRETEAEGVAFIVCTTLGIPAPASIDYIRSYRGTPDRLRDSLTRIRTTAKALLDVLLPPDEDPPAVDCSCAAVRAPALAAHGESEAQL